MAAEVMGPSPLGTACALEFWAGALRVMTGPGRVDAGPVGGPEVRAPGIVGGKAGGAGAVGRGEWPWIAADVDACAPLPDPPRVGRAAPPPPPSDRAGCQGVEMAVPLDADELAEKARLSGRPSLVASFAVGAEAVTSVTARTTPARAVRRYNRNRRRSTR